MKKIHIFLIFTLFSLLITNKLSAQLDTLNYIKQFEANKANYINQPFSKLLNDMTQIQPKTIWSYTGGRIKTKTLGSMFNFCAKEFSFNNVITLLVYWQDPIPRDQTKYYEQKNSFYFTSEEKNFYGSKIVKDVIVYR